MSTCTPQPPIEKRPPPSLEQVPAIKVCRLRRLIRGQVPDASGAYHLLLETGSGPQPLTLVPDARPYGPRFLATCSCGRRAAVLRLDATTGWWRCAKCLGLRCSRSRFRKSAAFRAFVLPALLLERARRRLAYRTAPKAKHLAFAELERQTIERMTAELERMLGLPK